MHDETQMHGFMAARDGKVFAEGLWTPYGPERIHCNHSLGKSYTAAAIGILYTQRKLKLEERVVDLFAEDVYKRQTLQTLKESAFNKIRFCIFPKHYDYNLGEPRSYPYEGTPMDSTVLTKDNFQEYTGKTEGNHFDLTLSLIHI